MTFIKKLEESLKLNQNYLFLLAIFNGAIVMNFHKLIYKNPLIMLGLLTFLIITIIDYKKWWSVIFNSFIAISSLVFVFPRIGNHSTFLLVISILLVGWIFLKWINFKVKIEANFISYLFRIATVSIYFYSGFHKLNTDFFNPCVSCVNEINEYTISNILNSDFKISSSLSRTFQFIAIILEMIVPFGLLSVKTRKYTVLVLLLFHGYLSLSVFADFSALALFLLIGCIHDFEGKEIPKQVVNYLKFYLVFLIFAVLCLGLLKYSAIIVYKHRFIQGVIFAIGYLTFGLIYLKNNKPKEFFFKKNYTIPLIITFLLLSFWTLKTYIGLGNAGNLTMFSNLVTEKRLNNHYLIDTKKTKLFDFEEDSVYIIFMNNPFVREKYDGYKIPVSEFRFLVNYWARKFDRPIACKLIYKGKQYNFDDLRTSEFKNSKKYYKYLNFRKIQTKSPNECRW